MTVCSGRSSHTSLAPSPAFSVYTPRPPSPGGEANTLPVSHNPGAPSAFPPKSVGHSSTTSSQDPLMDILKPYTSWLGNPLTPNTGARQVPIDFREITVDGAEGINNFLQSEPGMQQSLSHQATIHHDGHRLLPGDHIRSKTPSLLGQIATAANNQPSISPAPSPDSKHQLPNYVKALPERLTPNDIDYLIAKGALSIPFDLALGPLFESYLEHVYPSMPATDLPNL
jgi:hypothetical protein